MYFFCVYYPVLLSFELLINIVLILNFLKRFIFSTEKIWNILLLGGPSASR